MSRKISTIVGFFVVASIFIILSFLAKGGYKHTGFYKEMKIMESVIINTTVNSGKLTIMINNHNYITFKDLEIECSFIANSGSVIGGGKYFIYEIFEEKTMHTISNYIIPDLPLQTNAITCEAKNFIEINQELIVEDSFNKYFKKSEVSSESRDERFNRFFKDREKHDVINKNRYDSQ